MMRWRDRVDCRPAPRVPLVRVGIRAPGQSWYGQPRDKVDINTRWSVNEAYVLRRAHAELSLARSLPLSSSSSVPFPSLSRAAAVSLVGQNTYRTYRLLPAAFPVILSGHRRSGRELLLTCMHVVPSLPFTAIPLSPARCSRQCFHPL